MLFEFITRRAFKSPSQLQYYDKNNQTQVHTEESYEKLLWQFAESKMMDMWCRKHHLIPIYTHQEEPILNKMVVEAFLEAFNYKVDKDYEN